MSNVRLESLTYTRLSSRFALPSEMSSDFRSRAFYISTRVRFLSKVNVDDFAVGLGTYGSPGGLIDRVGDKPDRAIGKGRIDAP